jgi:hypothetical protein
MSVGSSEFVKTRQIPHVLSDGTSWGGGNRTGFGLKLELEEGSGAVLTESVGWLATIPTLGHLGGHAYEASLIAATRGQSNAYRSFDLSFGARFFSGPPRVFADLASFNGGDPVGLRMAQGTVVTSTSATLVLEEDDCSDAETNHVPEDIAVFALQGGREGMLRAVQCISGRPC